MTTHDPKVRRIKCDCPWSFIVRQVTTPHFCIVIYTMYNVMINYYLGLFIECLPWWVKLKAVTQVLTKDELRLLQEVLIICYDDPYVHLLCFITYVVLCLCVFYARYNILYTFVLTHTLAHICYPNVGSNDLDSYPRG